jgi:SAM-dependent methyltransferase
MNHADHVHLLRDGIAQPGGIWADFGSGGGAFTLALADLLGPTAEIHSIDRDAGALARQRRVLAANYPDVTLHTYEADFTRPLTLPPLDGLVAANALHFLPIKEAVVTRLRDYLRPGGRFLIVEYDTDRGNRWVPYPFSYDRWREIAARCDLHQTRKLAGVPSSFLGRFYSASSMTAQD